MYTSHSPLENMHAHTVVHERLPYTDREKYAHDIIDSTDFAEASHILKEEGLLQEHVLEVKEKYKEALETAHFLTERDWELLTLITLYSPELSTHCVETYQLVRDKIEHILLGSETIAQLILNENISLGEFFRACLLHDIGKTALPESVLNYVFAHGDELALSSTVREDMPQEKKEELLGLQTNDLETAYIETLSMSNYMNPAKNIPVSKTLPTTELEKLEQRGISTELTHYEILKLHEPASKKILNNEGLFIEAQIASQHHNYNNEAYQYPISSQTIGLSADLADLLHLADEESALRRQRPYKNAFSHTNVLYRLVTNAKTNAIKYKELTALWVEHDLATTTFEPTTAHDAQYMAEINAFVEQYRPKVK